MEGESTDIAPRVGLSHAQCRTDSRSLSVENSAFGGVSSMIVKLP